MSAMRDTMLRQPADLREILGDPDPAARAAGVIAGQRVLLVGTGTSFHAANHGAWLLREAGIEAWAVEAIDAALHRPRPGAGDALILLSHTGAKRYSREVQAEARAGLVPTVTIGARGVEGVDVSTVVPETSSAYTASHMGALLRLAQIATELGARLGPLEAVVPAVERVLEGSGPGIRPPVRLLEYIGAGPNAWTAAEGALKVRETARIAAEGMNAEQFFHGPSVALDSRDTLICLDGGGPASGRLASVADAADQVGVDVRFISSPPELGEPLSVFPLTAAIQRIALECAEAAGTDPDAFGYDVPGREAAWEPLGF
jgi:glucosamine--fructose-6-phosphate aminotransferase (isomerizing)